MRTILCILVRIRTRSRYASTAFKKSTSTGRFGLWCYCYFKNSFSKLINWFQNWLINFWIESGAKAEIVADRSDWQQLASRIIVSYCNTTSATNVSPYASLYVVKVNLIVSRAPMYIISLEVIHRSRVTIILLHLYSYIKESWLLTDSRKHHHTTKSKLIDWFKHPGNRILIVNRLHCRTQWDWVKWPCERSHIGGLPVWWFEADQLDCQPLLVILCCRTRWLSPIAKETLCNVSINFCKSTINNQTEQKLRQDLARRHWVRGSIMSNVSTVHSKWESDRTGGGSRDGMSRSDQNRYRRYCKP